MAGDGYIFAFLEDMFAQLVAGFIIPFIVFIIMEEPATAAMGQQAIGMLVRVRAEAYETAGGPG